MDILSLLYGACIASLVWVAVVMALLQREKRDMEDIHDLMQDYFKANEERVELMKGHIDHLGEICTSMVVGVDKIFVLNKEFSAKIVELVDDWRFKG